MFRCPSRGREFGQELNREIAESGKHSCQVFENRDIGLRQLSTMERIAATFGSAWALPTWIQFFLPTAMGRMEFSARLLLSSSSGYFRKHVSLRHSVRVWRQALPSAPEGSIATPRRYTSRRRRRSTNSLPIRMVNDPGRSRARRGHAIMGCRDLRTLPAILTESQFSS